MDDLLYLISPEVRRCFLPYNNWSFETPPENHWIIYDLHNAEDRFENILISLVHADIKSNKKLNIGVSMLETFSTLSARQQNKLDTVD